MKAPARCIVTAAAPVALSVLAIGRPRPTQPTTSAAARPSHAGQTQPATACSSGCGQGSTTPTRLPPTPSSTPTLARPKPFSP
jgi:hypothetical protein